jgi:hypothetical protein
VSRHAPGQLIDLELAVLENVEQVVGQIDVATVAQIGRGLRCRVGWGRGSSSPVCRASIAWAGSGGGP